MKTILIAGGCGFIGSNMCKRLLYENNRIICLDNLFTGKLENIKELNENKNFTYINHDIIHPINIEENIHEIYHFACPASPPKYQIDPVYTLKTNFIGTMNLLELAREKKCKILLSSTSEIYGELKIVRIFNTYGPNMDINDGRVITNFIQQILNNDDITLYGDGSQTRSFCYIDDQIEGLIRLMGSCYNYPVNIGNPNELTVKELANILLKLMISKTNIIYLPLPEDDPTNRKPDITLAKELLDWTPKTELINGLNETINYFKILYK